MVRVDVGFMVRVGGKRQRERVGGAAKEAASLIQCVLGEVRVGKAMLKGQ